MSTDTTEPTTRTSTKAEAFTDEEKAAMKERAKELKAEARRSKAGKGDGEADLLAKVAELPEADRVMAERIHTIVKETAPDLESRTYYGMPAWARNGKVICFFQPASKFKARYATFGFNDDATLDDGAMWPTSWALTTLTAAGEKAIAELVKKAVG